MNKDYFSLLLMGFFQMLTRALRELEKISKCLECIKKAQRINRHPIHGGQASSLDIPRAMCAFPPFDSIQNRRDLRSLNGNPTSLRELPSFCLFFFTLRFFRMAPKMQRQERASQFYATFRSTVRNLG
jgi:hypothetical protein